MPEPISVALRDIRQWLDKYPQHRDGLLAHEHATGKWRVIYPDGGRSEPMLHGTATDYCQIFGGRVVHIDDKKTGVGLVDGKPIRFRPSDALAEQELSDAEHEAGDR